jgi:hypothetical protein
MRVFSSRSWLMLVWLSLVLGAGCADQVPSPSLVEDLRVLAIQAQPPELLFDRDPGAVAQTVTFQALVMDPRGGPMAYDWAFCPVESSQTCADFDRRKAAVAPAVQPILDTARAQASHGEAPPAPEHTDALQIGAFAAQVSPELFAFHVTSSGLGLGNGAWLSAALALGNGADSLQAEKRVVLEARDLSAWNPELASSGWQICPPAPALALPGCLPLAPRTANRNPEIAGVEVARSRLADALFAPLEGPLVLGPHETVRLRPVVGADAAERYQAIEATFQGDQLVVVDHQEELVVSWFATAGTFADAQTTPQRTKTLDNAFTTPDAPPAATGGKLSVFMVVRDQRGGTGWARVEVLMMP